MPHAITMPKLGQYTEECKVLQWLKKEGDWVARGELLFVIETDKAAMEIESFFEGTLLKILIPEGATVPVQTTLAFVGTPGEPLPEVIPPPAPAAPRSAPPRAADQIPTIAGSAAMRLERGGAARTQGWGGPGGSQTALTAPAPASPAPPKQILSPRARRLARESAIDPAPIGGSGPNGRVIERDVLAYLEQRGYARLRVTPSAKALAILEGVDLLSVEGSGEGGRITAPDIRNAIAEKPRPLTRMRQTIGRRLSQSWTTAPHFFVTVSVDMTGLLKFRQTLKRQGEPYSVTDFILAAVARTLREFPAYNSATDGQSVRWRSRVNLGMAVAVDNGLRVPVIRRADELSLRELRDAATALADKARAGKLSPDEMTGGSFTVSNLGMMNVEQFTAILNPGESGILAVASVGEQPVVRNKKVVIRSMMKMTVSSDHRLIDGVTAARFLNAIKDKLENVTSWIRSILR